MRRLHLFLLLFLSFTYVNSQGLNFSTQEELSGFKKFNNQTYGFSADIPSSYSFEEFVPNVLEQSGSTCVGYATLYYALSTMYNIKFDITSTRGKLAHSFDPNYIYTLINNNILNPCDEGLLMYQATEMLQNVGAKKLLYPPYLTCETRWTEENLNPVLDYTLPYAIKDFIYVDMALPNLIDLTKQALYYDIPIVSGFYITESLYPKSSSNFSGVDNSGLWSPNELEDEIGGHAMTLVGYDDFKYGGSFRVVNSWGNDYGDAGYIWIRYEDWVKYAKESYILELNDNVNTDSDEFEIVENDYVRIKNNSNSYEGQRTDYSYYDGLGVYFDYESDRHFIGNFDDAEMDGYFIILDSDGLASTTVVNGNFTDYNQLGFAGDGDLKKKNDSINTYLENIGIKYKIRKANSTKNISTKIEN
jgi:hypothetical protein